MLFLKSTERSRDNQLFSYFNCRPSDCPLTPTKITKKGDMYWFFPGNALVYQCFTLGTLKEPGLSCVVGAPVSS